jgi:hypothetical protein
MKFVKIASLVEGDGEVQSVPLLLRRVIATISPAINATLPRGFRHPSGSILRPGGLERALDAVAECYPGHAILVLIDCDDDCPKDLGVSLVERAQRARPDLAVSIVLAYREYEAWFIAAAESIAGVRNLEQPLLPPPDPEAVRNAKGWLTDRMGSKARYSPTQDQAALSSRFDLALAYDRSRSFRKLWTEVERLLHIASEGSTDV